MTGPKVEQARLEVEQAEEKLVNATEECVTSHSRLILTEQVAGEQSNQPHARLPRITYST